MKIHKKSLEILEMTNEIDWNIVKNGLRWHAPKISTRQDVEWESRLKEKMKLLS